MERWPLFAPSIPISISYAHVTPPVRFHPTAAPSLSPSFTHSLSCCLSADSLMETQLKTPSGCDPLKRAAQTQAHVNTRVSGEVYGLLRRSVNQPALPPVRICCHSLRSLWLSPSVGHSSTCCISFSPSFCPFACQLGSRTHTFPRMHAHKHMQAHTHIMSADLVTEVEAGRQIFFCQQQEQLNSYESHFSTSLIQCVFPGRHSVRLCVLVCVCVSVCACCLSRSFFFWPTHCKRKQTSVCMYVCVRVCT